MSPESSTNFEICQKIIPNYHIHTLPINIGNRQKILCFNGTFVLYTCLPIYFIISSCNMFKFNFRSTSRGNQELFYRSDFFEEPIGLWLTNYSWCRRKGVQFRIYLKTIVFIREQVDESMVRSHQIKANRLLTAAWNHDMRITSNFIKR